MARVASAIDANTQLAIDLSSYADDPVGFCEDILNVELSAEQQEAAEAFARTGRVSIRSGHGAGKSMLIGCLILWLLCTRPMVEGCVTAPTFRQLTNVIFRRIEEVLKKSLIRDLVIYKKTSVAFGDNLISAATARKGEGLQGLHADPEIGSIGIFIEEASGVPDDFFDPLEGALSTGKSYILMAGNPTQRHGKFFDSHHKDRADWYTMRISAADSPFVNQGWVEGRKKAWGEDSDQYRVRVLGEFPSVDGLSLIPLSWLEDAKLISETPHTEFCSPADSYVISIDPARQGPDSTFVAVRRGRFILGEFFARFRGLRTTEVAGYAQHLYEELLKLSPVNPNTGGLIRPVVCVDAVGIGAGVYDILHDAGVNVRQIQAATLTPDTLPRCHRLRDWLYWQTRELFNPENELDPVILIPGKRRKSGGIVAIEEKDKLVEAMISELSGLLFRYLPGDVIAVESKDDYKARNSGHSPDGADSISFGFCRDNRAPRKKVVDIFSRARGRHQEQGWHA